MKLPLDPDGNVTIVLTIDGQSKRLRLSRDHVLKLMGDVFDTYRCGCGLVHPDGPLPGAEPDGPPLPPAGGMQN
jgi:hypothetical protein